MVCFFLFLSLARAALIYECVKTITSIHPKPALLEAAASSISQFITSKRYLAWFIFAHKPSCSVEY